MALDVTTTVQECFACAASERGMGLTGLSTVMQITPCIWRNIPISLRTRTATDALCRQRSRALTGPGRLRRYGPAPGERGFDRSSAVTHRAAISPLGGLWP